MPKPRPDAQSNFQLGAEPLAELAAEPAADHAGHRARLRQRLIRGGGEALLDHELIEYLLALSIPRRDTKPLAKTLLREFGGIGGLFAADAEALSRISGMGEGAVAAILIARASALRLLHAEVQARPVLSSWQAVLDYLRADMAHHPVERFRILFLNTRNILIRDEVMSEGSIDQAPVSVREVIRRAIDLGATALVLVHNHPSGDARPSRADIVLTRDIIEAGRRLNIAVHDHLIMAASGYTSLKGEGLI